MQQRKKEKKKWNIQGQGSRIENICQLVYKLPFFLYMLPNGKKCNICQLAIKTCTVSRYFSHKLLYPYFFLMDIKRLNTVKSPDSFTFCASTVRVLRLTEMAKKKKDLKTRFLTTEWLVSSRQAKQRGSTCLFCLFYILTYSYRSGK